MFSQRFFFSTFENNNYITYSLMKLSTILIVLLFVVCTSQAINVLVAGQTGGLYSQILTILNFVPGIVITQKANIAAISDYTGQDVVLFTANYSGSFADPAYDYLLNNQHNGMFF
jgi:hypothetical protein